MDIQLTFRYTNYITTKNTIIYFVDAKGQLVGNLDEEDLQWCQVALKQLLANNDLKAEQLASHCFLHGSEHSRYQSILLFALGKQPKQDYWKLLQKLSQRIIASKKAEVVIDLQALETLLKSFHLLEDLITTLQQQHYQFNHYKTNTEPKIVSQYIELFATNINCSIGTTSSFRADELNNGQTIGRAINFCKDLGNHPANVCTPTYLAEQAKHIVADNSASKCTILEEETMQQLGMHSLLSVSKGSILKPKLIVIDYQGGDKDDQPIALVGKGVTFDTGGISLKPGARMDEMKYDMCGAATVLAVAKAVIELKLRINLVVVVPAVENMPSDRASKPGDIVKSMNGKTIEILNTDAEGRLILCDAMTYVIKEFQPKTMIDVATLTGACIVALGHHLSGLYSNDDKLRQQLLDAGVAAGDEAWAMPLGDKFSKQLESPFADLANIGGPTAGSVTAAAFLQEFVEDVPWAHFDIAGTAWETGGNKGATGRPVALLVRYLRQLVTK